MTQLAIDRAADADRLRGDEPLDRRRHLQRPRLPQEQRARGLLLGAARAAADRLDRRLRPPAARRGHQLRRHRPRRGHRRCRRSGSATSTVLTQRAAAAVASPFASVRMRQFDATGAPGRRCLTGGPVPLAELLAEHDIVVNCILQDTDAPLMFVTNEDLARFPPGSAVRRRLLRRGHGLRVGAPDDVRRPDVRRSATASTTTPSTTARRTCGTRRPGRTARRCSRTCRRSWPGPRPGPRTRRSAARSRSRRA